MDDQTFARFIAKIDENGPIPEKYPELGPCWIWTAGKTDDGYGKFHVGMPRRAHRLAFEIEHGPIPDGLFCLHHCDNRPCVNPDHLFLGSGIDNMRDCAAKERLQSALSDAEIISLCSEYAANPAPMVHLAQKYDAHRTTIANILDRRGLRVPKHRLSDSDVVSINLDYAAHRMTMLQLAAKYGVSQTTIAGILARNPLH